MSSKKSCCMKFSFLFVGLHLFSAVQAADNSPADKDVRALIAQLPKNLCKKNFYMAEEQGKIFTGIKPGSLLDLLTPALAVTKAGQEFLARCQLAKNKPIESVEVAAMNEVLGKVDMHLPANFSQQDTSPVKIMQRLADSFGYQTIPTSSHQRMVFNKLYPNPRKSACQKFNDFVSQVFDRLNS